MGRYGPMVNLFRKKFGRANNFRAGFASKNPEYPLKL